MTALFSAAMIPVSSVKIPNNFSSDLTTNYTQSNIGNKSVELHPYINASIDQDYKIKAIGERGEVLNDNSYTKNEVDLKLENINDKVDSKFELLSEKIDNGFKNQQLLIESKIKDIQIEYKDEQSKGRREFIYWSIGTTFTILGIIVPLLFR